jgi:hypothetical protein
MIPKSINVSHNAFEGFERTLFAAIKVYTMSIGYQIGLILIVVIIFSTLLDQLMTHYKNKKKDIGE